MKKIALSLAGVLAAVAFAPEASALPVFARQTGMACLACHFNHAPLLNGFGRAFKSAGYSMMGSQGKVEGEGLDIPDRLNLAVLTTAGYDKETGGKGAISVPAAGGELSLFAGGRIMESMGFLTELGFGGPTAGTGAAKLLWMPEVAEGVRLGLVLDTNNGQGVAHGFEILNTGAVNVHKIGIDDGTILAYSAAQYLATNNATTGASVVLQGDKGYINLSRYEAAGQAAVSDLGAAFPSLPGLSGKVGASGIPLTYLRIAGVGFDVAGFEVSGGLQKWSGSSSLTQFGVQIDSQSREYTATVIDIQAQGAVSGMSTGIYASYGNAPAGSVYAQGGSSAAKSINVGIDMNVGHELIVRAAIRRATSGHDGLKDNAISIGGVYELAQNVELHVAHTINSGTTASSGYAGADLSAGSVSLTSIKAEVLF